MYIFRVAIFTLLLIILGVYTYQIADLDQQWYSQEERVPLKREVVPLTSGTFEGGHRLEIVCLFVCSFVQPKHYSGLLTRVKNTATTLAHGDIKNEIQTKIVIL